MTADHSAFILSRPADLPLAEASLHHLTALGWQAILLLDPREISTHPRAVFAEYARPGRKMCGNPCHEAILGAILEHSFPGQIVAKFDCDIALTSAASSWLLGATTRARALHWRGKRWGGMWAAPRDQVARLAAHALTVRRCACPESALAIAGFEATGGIDFHPLLTVATWHPGTPMDPTAGAWTLPMTGRAHLTHTGLGLFAHPF